MSSSPPDSSPRVGVPGRVRPLGAGHLLQAVWRNRDSLPYAWKVLTRGACDGCALGASGLSDWTRPGIHLCATRLEGLRTHTMGPMRDESLADVARLEGLSGQELGRLGRLAYPLRRRRGQPGFTRVSFAEVWQEVGERWGALAPERTGMCLASRGLTNEVYYVAQKVMRLLGSNNVDHWARLHHAPSGVGLRSTLGVGRATGSYSDWYDADLLVFFGSDPASDQPVATRYLAAAARRGARVLAVDAQAGDGTAFAGGLADRVFAVRPGGDLAFLNAVQKVVLTNGWQHEQFVQRATHGIEALRLSLDRQPMNELLERCGLPLSEVQAFARELAGADRGVFVWSTGVYQHDQGEDTVRALVNLGLLREYVGRPGTGFMPVQGHGGVQGGSDMGADPGVFPGGLAVNLENALHFGALWGFDVPDREGLGCAGMLEAAAEGRLEGLYTAGGNVLEAVPDPERAAAALARIPLRIHTDIVATSQMLTEPEDTVFLLPACTRHEQRDGGTDCSTERRVIFTPFVPGHCVGQATSDWELLLAFARAVRPERQAFAHFEDGDAIRRDIGRAVPAYAPIADLRRPGDQFQLGGERLCTGRTFPTPDGKARFAPVAPAGLSQTAPADAAIVS